MIANISYQKAVKRTLRNTKEKLLLISPSNTGRINFAKHIALLEVIDASNYEVKDKSEKEKNLEIEKSMERLDASCDDYWKKECELFFPKVNLLDLIN